MLTLPDWTLTGAFTGRQTNVNSSGEPATRRGELHTLRVRVALINTSLATSQVVAIRAASRSGTATIERRQAPSMSSRAGVTLAGQSTDAKTGELHGAPQMHTVLTRDRRCVVTLPSAGAALVTMPSARS